MFFICVYAVHPRMIYCIFVAFMFWDTISVKRVDGDMLCFCGEMVMIAKAKAINFQDILQLAPCFCSRGFSEKSVSELHPFHSCVFSKSLEGFNLPTLWPHAQLRFLEIVLSVCEGHVMTWCMTTLHIFRCSVF